jgi:hypothetical protein
LPIWVVGSAAGGLPAAAELVQLVVVVDVPHPDGVVSRHSAVLGPAAAFNKHSATQVLDHEHGWQAALLF